MNGERLETLLLLGLGAASVLACNLFDETGATPQGCAKDTDCKGSRICVNARCVEPAAGKQPSPPQPALTPQPQPQPEKATPPSQPAAAAGPCADPDVQEIPCKLPDGRVGWCKNRRCKDICPPGHSYSHLDTACHRPCTASCSHCMENLCFDSSAPLR